MNKLFEQRVKEYFNEESEKYLELLNKKPTHGFFINTLKGNKEDILNLLDFKYEESYLNPNAYYHDYDSIGKCKAYELGLIYPQDTESSYSSTFINDIDINLIVDLCAAPGGKSINIINKYKDALCVSNDVNSKRVGELSKNLERLGLTNSIITSKNPKDLAKELKGNVDLVILDAPCSGEGMIRKYPEILDDYSLANIESLAKIQEGLLENAYDLVRKDGYILYSTCTYAFEEDENQIRNFLNKHSDIELIKLSSKNNYSKLEGTIKLCPLNNTEGQFICLLKRTSDNEIVKIKYLKPIKNDIVDKFISSNLNISDYYLYKVNDNFFMSINPMIALGGGVIRSGIYLGELKKNRFEPAHNLYRSIYLKDAFKYKYDLNDDEYDKYIKGLELNVDLDDNYYLLTYKGYSLGFGKVSNKTMKNKYPKGLRRVC